jgi:hypothetical protein
VVLKPPLLQSLRSRIQSNRALFLVHAQGDAIDQISPIAKLC